MDRKAIDSTSASATLISLAKPDAWTAALAETGPHDVYHTAAYHAAIRFTDPGEAYLFRFRMGGTTAVVPLLLRPLAGLPWPGAAGRDAISAYGYPGPLCSDPAPGAPFLNALHDALAAQLRDRDVICAFVRLHPLLSDPALLQTVGEVVDIGPTVAIDLHQPDEEYRRQTRKSHRYEIKKTARAGVVVAEDPDLSTLGVFESLYEATMRRREASTAYFFPSSYFAALRDELAGSVSLVNATLDGQIIGAAIVLEHAPFIQYHLSATREGFEQLSPTRLIIEHVRQQERSRDFRWLHLGGGVGGREESLFRFKAGFSRIRWTYRVARLVMDAPAYERACAAHAAWLEHAGRRISAASFFPRYRDPGA